MASSDSLKVVPIVTDRRAGDVVAARYRLVRKVGSGGMGSVWYAQDLSLDAPCAVKLIDGEKAHDESIRMRFEREAKASAQLRSAHVVNVFDYGEWNRTQYLAMEYLDGEDLAVRLMRLGRLDFESTYRVIAHVARALMAAHAVGIVHRDLKPENIFLVQSYDEELAKVLDFGIAQHNAYSVADRATREGAFLGTPCYVSPEQARGRQIDHRSDLWSLGVIAFQCLTGQLPFEGKALGELMGQILYEPLPVPSLVNRSLPKQFDDWWQRAASRNREDRFQSAKEMADRLGAVLGVESVVVVPTMPPRHRASFPPPAEYSGVITAAKLPAAAIRTTAAAPEVDQALGADEVLSPTRDELPAPAGGSPRDVHEYIAQLAAEPLVPTPAPRALPDVTSNSLATPFAAGPSGGAARGPLSSADWQSGYSLGDEGASPATELPLGSARRAEQASEVRFIEREVRPVPAFVAFSTRGGFRRLRGYAMHVWHVARYTVTKRYLRVVVPVVAAIAILCTVLWLTLRSHEGSKTVPDTQVQAALTTPAPNARSEPTPRPAASPETLTVDMLPLISGKGRNTRSGNDTSGRAPQSQGGATEQKQSPRSPRAVQPSNDYGI